MPSSLKSAQKCRGHQASLSLGKAQLKLARARLAARSVDTTQSQTAQGKGTQWQMRVHYYWFKKQQKACREQYGDKCHMGGFTRLLHSGADDELSSEIPTYVVNPLPSGSNGYVVRVQLWLV